MVDPNHPLQDQIDATTKECIARNPEMDKSPAVMDWLKRLALSKQRIQYQRTFSGTGNAGHTGQATYRDPGGNPFQVVFPGILYDQEAL